MTPQVTHPGVYVAELPAEGHKIVGVSSSITAFIGRASKGPFNRAIKCKSIRGAVRRFGGPHPRRELARSLKMFFDNGGSECFVRAGAICNSFMDNMSKMSPDVRLFLALGFFERERPSRSFVE